MHVISLLLCSVNIPAEHCTVQQVSVCSRVTLMWHCWGRLRPQVQKVFLLKRRKLQNPVSCLLLILTNLDRYVLPHFQKYLVPVCRLCSPVFNKLNYKTVWEFKSSGMWCCVIGEWFTTLLNIVVPSASSVKQSKKNSQHRGKHGDL